ncbi:hypothetical protein ACA910_009091 [Epithemia clementina (nom. ined.)]
MDGQKSAGAAMDATAGGGDKSAPAMVNPHNPEFITKKPWYLGDSTDEPTLEHQTAPTLNKKVPLSLAASEALVAQQRAVQDKFEKGQWVEALKKNKLPYRICQILSVNAKQTEFDLKYEDGTTERRVKLFAGSKQRPRIRRTKRGTRSINVEATGMTETYDSKRDAYHGYDQQSHNATLTARFEERERIRRKFRESLKVKSQQQSKEGGGKGDDNHVGTATVVDSDNEGEGGDEEEEDEFVQRDEDDKVITTRLARQGGVGGAQMKVTARNLRIREDTAKYLRNLDPNSAYYDPKSRSMRDNPNPEMAPEESQFAGDNFARISGDAVQLADSQLFAWEAAEKGVAEVHPQANPSQVELLKKQYRTKATDLKMEKKKAVLEKYGGEEYLDGTGGLASVVETKKPSRKIRFGASTQVETYHPDGKRVGAGGDDAGGNQKRVAIPSKYEENVFINGHYSVWGSYFHKGAFQWGYADDHSLIKMSYCTGEAGRLANDEANELQYGTGKAGSAELAQARRMLQVSSNKNKNSKSAASTNLLNRSKLYGEADVHQTLDLEKVQAATERAKKGEHGKATVDEDDAGGSDDLTSKKKRKYNSMKAAEAESMTAEEMEAYRITKDRSSDPMANLGDAELLDYS